MSLYNLRKTPNGYRVSKFDEDYNIESAYEMTDKDGVITCSCPQSNRGPCRHLDIFDAFETYGRADTGWFYEHETRDWLPPIESSEVPPSLAAGGEGSPTASTSEVEAIEETKPPPSVSPAPSAGGQTFRRRF